ncbi:hypothetical protein [Thiocapsa sp.]|uniref:hypothetical protein n=1 Tax=Thiocapsa sp. TaxID=2024551 RepID=UPI002D80AAD1|nr:hypothetical protein [Thiocapsa sp.]
MEGADATPPHPVLDTDSVAAAGATFSCDAVGRRTEAASGERLRSAAPGAALVRLP